MEKLKLRTILKSGDKVIIGIEKSSSFFTLFPKFLIQCGMTKNVFVEDYAENIPNIKSMTDTAFTIENYVQSIVIIFGINEIFVIMDDSENLIVNISSIINFER